MTTTRKVEANRRNALASTGPRTPEGKAATSRNAVRHGIRSGLRVLPGVESRKEWLDHLEAVMRDLHPAGHVESVLAEMM